MKVFKKIIAAFSSRFIKPRSWVEFEYFDNLWADRVRQMATFIPHGHTVLDLGCGKMHLKEHINKENYYPVDYLDRGEGTIICDFSKYEFPSIQTDVSFVSGCLEYIPNYTWFISKVCLAKSIVILSYCTTDEFPSPNERKRNGWANHLSRKKLVLLFKNNGFHLVEEALTPQHNSIFFFKKHLL